MATLSLMGMYNYDPTLFEGLQLPTAADITDEADKVSDPWIPDKQEFVDYLVMECAELELLRPSAPTMKKMISIWSDARQPVWKALYNTLLYKYNPIWNKDGTIEETNASSGNDTLTRNLTGSDNETRNLQTVDAGTSSSTSEGTAEHNVTGYDANTYSPDTQDTTEGTTSGTTGNTRTETGTVNRARTDGGTEATARESEGSVRRVERGNIGVTMTQDMIRQQRDIVMFNLYDVIVQEFKSRFCLLVY